MKKSRFKKLLGVISSAALAAALFTACGQQASDTGTETSSGSSSSSSDEVKVGLLHSLTGSMAISEKSVRDAEVLAIEEINASGGVLGKKIVYAEEDGASEPSTFATKAENVSVNYG